MTSSFSLVAEVLHWPEIQSPELVRASAHAANPFQGRSLTFTSQESESTSHETTSPATDEFVRWGQLFAQDYDRNLHPPKG